MFLIFLKCSELSKHYQVKRGRKKDTLKALDNVDFSLTGDVSVGVVGESGCGKSTLLKLLLGLENPTYGEIEFKGHVISNRPERELRFYRQEVQAVFQDAAASLNPRLSVKKAVAEPLINYNPDLKRNKLEEKVTEALILVGLDPARANRFPHEFSGGQQRRIALARALIARPHLILCDEATSGLDVSVQAQLLNLLKDLRESCGLQYLFVSHDLAVVRYLCPHLIVMYGGQIVEELPTSKLHDALHPYTRALIFSEPELFRSKKPFILQGEPPDPAAFPPGCRFYPRCPVRENRCESKMPALIEIEQGRKVACWKQT